eukprot:365810-Chlamydomonas_euryale.AAC.20
MLPSAPGRPRCETCVVREQRTSKHRRASHPNQSVQPHARRRGCAAAPQARPSRVHGCPLPPPRRLQARLQTAGGLLNRAGRGVCAPDRSRGHVVLTSLPTAACSRLPAQQGHSCAEWRGLSAQGRLLQSRRSGCSSRRRGSLHPAGDSSDRGAAHERAAVQLFDPHCPSIAAAAARADCLRVHDAHCLAERPHPRSHACSSHRHSTCHQQREIGRGGGRHCSSMHHTGAHARKHRAAQARRSPYAPNTLAYECTNWNATTICVRAGEGAAADAGSRQVWHADAHAHHQQQHGRVSMPHALAAHLLPGEPPKVQRALRRLGAGLRCKAHVHKTLGVAVHMDVLHLPKLGTLISYVRLELANPVGPAVGLLLGCVEHVLQQDALRGNGRRWAQQALVEHNIRRNLRLRHGRRHRGRDDRQRWRLGLQARPSREPLHQRSASLRVHS